MIGTFTKYSLRHRVIVMALLVLFLGAGLGAFQPGESTGSGTNTFRFASTPIRACTPLGTGSSNLIS